MVAAVRIARSWWHRHPMLAWSIVGAVVLATTAITVVAFAVSGTTANAPGTLTVNTASTFSTTATCNKNEVLQTVVFSFPANTDASGANISSYTGGYGTAAITSASAQSVTVTITNGSFGARSAFTLTLGNVIQPSEPGSYTWATTVTSGNGPLADTSDSYALTSSATAVTGVTATPSTSVELAAAGYTVGFTTGAAGRLSGATDASLAPNGGANSIVITFPSDTTVPTSPSASNVSINGSTPQAVSVSGRVVTLYLASSQTIAASSSVSVVFNSSFGLMNPSAGSYTLGVYTSAQTNGATSGSYSITTQPKLTVTQGGDPGRPVAKVYSGRSANAVVDELSLAASGGTMTLTQIVVRGLDTVPANLATDVTGIKLYRDNGGTAGEWDGTDSQLGTTQTFSGTTATFSGLSLAIANGVTEKVWIVYTIGASAVDGDIVGSQLSVGDVTASGGNVAQAADIVSAGSGQTIQVDAAAPSADTSDPLNDGRLTGASKTISGTATDGTGSGVSFVEVKIQRSDLQYWNGTGWVGTETWNGAIGITNWTYVWSLDAGQNGTYTYTITARATDAVALTGADATPVTGVKVDNVAPTITSATAVDSTHVDVVFSEALQSGSIASTDFTIAGLTVSGAVLQADNVTVRLTTSAQDAVGYTVSCAAGNVLDLADNGNTAGTANFTGIDGIAPTLNSAAAVNATTVDVVFSEALQSGSIASTDFTIAGLTVSGAVLQADNVTVRLTTSAQDAVGYTVSCAAGNVLDLAGNGNTAGTANFSGFGSTGDVTPPTPPTTVTATAGGASPIIATISWSGATDDIGVIGFKVWRAPSETGTYVLLGEDSASPFDDTRGVPGQDYWYKVSALDAAGNESGLSAAAGPVVAGWTQAPHTTYSSATKLCAMCHAPHVAATARYIFRDTGSTPADLSICYACHDGSGATFNAKTGAANSFSLASGHTLEATDPAANLTNSCSSCHSPHSDYATNPALPKETVNGAAVNPAVANSLCLACHDVNNSWYGAGYPNSATPTVDATGYPTVGTFPTVTGSYVAYTDAALNAHYSMPASPTADPARVQGDCLYCHASHRSGSAYDSLVAAFRPVTTATLADDQTNGTYAAVCFKCHGNNDYGFAAPATNVKQFVTAGGARSGHRIKTSGGTYPVGAPLPCYECHNPHGSARTNRQMLNDALGQSLETTTVAGGEHLVREFCFTCHTTTDTAAGWDSVGAAYTVAIASGKTVAGLPRDAAVGANVLRLPDAAGHHQADAQSCYACHGSDYTSAASNNVHNPGSGVSTGGTDCYVCHASYQASMEDDSGTKAGADNALSYHHVLGDATTYDGDKAFAAGAYPTSTTDVYCLSCHVDHDKFNANKDGNLRPDITTLNPTGVSTDYDSTSNTGVCTSCHATSLTKQGMGTEQKNDGSTATPKILEGGTADQFGASAHDYYATSTFGAGNTFNANCSKCHNDEQAKSFQDSTFTFGTHWSSARRILSALGGSVADPMAENRCYGCHTGVAAGNDYYGVAAMTAAAKRVNAQFQLTGSKHPVVAAGGGSVECESCHNAHVVSATATVSDPDNTYNTVAYATDANQATFCLKCHDGALPAYTVNTTTYIPYTVTQGGTLNNKNTYAARGHWSVVGAIGSGEEVSCAECHENHGSAAPKLLGAYDMTDSRNEIAGAAITANDNTVCAACHASATGTAYTRLANGYPDVGTWPGTTVYNGATGIHKGAAVVYPGSTYAGGDCKNCHDVHGTAYPYDETVGQFDPTSAGNDRYALCFSCHDSDGPSTRNIKQYFPVADGGLATGGNYGHVIKTGAGTLSAGQGLPCYDCHNPHGSAIADGLLVMSQNNGVTYAVGDAAGEINIGTATGNRQFCFLCHSTGDATAQITDPTDGAGYVNVTGTALVEGLNRAAAIGANKLRLPAVSGHYQADTTSCYGCHGNDYSGATTNNVHNPGAGGSTGGSACNTCHATHATMTNDTTTYHHVLDSATPFRAPAAGNTYPTSTAALECVSCHADHNYFNSQKGFNLRTDLSATAAPTNSDFPGGGTYGICVACHSITQTKNTTGQKTGGSTTTPIISGSGFDASAHDYQVNSGGVIGFGTTAVDTFKANCSKCHDDDMDTGSKMTSTYKIGVHKSSENRIAKALGAALAGASTSSEENLCYKCHTGGTAGTDGYGAGSMSADARSIYTEFNDAGKPNKHPVAATSGVHQSYNEGTSAGWNPASGRHVECEDCHNVHEAQADTTAWPTNQARRGNTPPPIAGATKGVWGVTISGAAANGTWTGSGTSGAPTAPTYSRVSSSSYQWQLCLKCHSSWSWTSTPPNSSLNLQGQTGGKQTDVGADFNPMQLSYHPIFAPGLNQPAINLNGAWTSSTMRKWIDLDNDNVNDGTAETNNNGLSNTLTDGWVTTSIVVCTDCHNNSNPAGPEGPHASANKWILSGVDINVKSTLQDGSVVTNGSYASANFCINCHRVDVYGTNEKAGLNATAALLSRMNHGRMSSSCYNTGTFNSTALTWSSCLHCHGGRKSQTSYNNPANTDVQNGAIHGTSMTYHPSAATYTGAANYMGQRFMNGASWTQHLLGKTTTTVGCYNFSKTITADNYSACTKHVPSEYTELQYAY